MQRATPSDCREFLAIQGVLQERVPIFKKRIAMAVKNKIAGHMEGSCLDDKHAGAAGHLEGMNQNTLTKSDPAEEKADLTKMSSEAMRQRV
mgnify:CR=1 FL=1